MEKIKRLESTITKNGFIYRQIERNATAFIYAQHNKQGGEILTYEVFKNKLGDQHKAKGRWAKLQNLEFNPENYEQFYEIFPGDEEFGKRAWTYKKLSDAIVKYKSL